MEDIKGLEEQESITYDEFRAWLTGLIRGKRGALPDLNDWKIIKTMMDKVVVPQEQVVNPLPIDPYPPSFPPYIPQGPYDTPTWNPLSPNWQNPIICGDGTGYVAHSSRGDTGEFNENAPSLKITDGIPGGDCVDVPLPVDCSLNFSYNTNTYSYGTCTEMANKIENLTPTYSDDLGVAIQSMVDLHNQVQNKNNIQ